MAKAKKTEKRKRHCVTIYFESEQQLNRLCEIAGGNLSEYCRERILYDAGYADDRQHLAARLSRLADALWSELHRICDLVRALYAVRQEIRRHPDSSAELIHARLDKVDDLIGLLLRGSERRADIQVNLTKGIDHFALRCVELELAQNRAATFQKRHAVKP